MSFPDLKLLFLGFPSRVAMTVAVIAAIAKQRSTNEYNHERIVVFYLQHCLISYKTRPSTILGRHRRHRSRSTLLLLLL